MAPVEFKKMLCHPVEVKGQGPLSMVKISFTKRLNKYSALDFDVNNSLFRACQRLFMMNKWRNTRKISTIDRNYHFTFQI